MRHQVGEGLALLFRLLEGDFKAANLLRNLFGGCGPGGPLGLDDVFCLVKLVLRSLPLLLRLRFRGESLVPRIFGHRRVEAVIPLLLGEIRMRSLVTDLVLEDAGVPQPGPDDVLPVPDVADTAGPEVDLEIVRDLVERTDNHLLDDVALHVTKDEHHLDEANELRMGAILSAARREGELEPAPISAGELTVILVAIKDVDVVVLALHLPCVNLVPVDLPRGVLHALDAVVGVLVRTDEHVGRIGAVEEIEGQPAGRPQDDQEAVRGFVRTPDLEDNIRGGACEVMFDERDLRGVNPEFVLRGVSGVEYRQCLRECRLSRAVRSGDMGVAEYGDLGVGEGGRIDKDNFLKTPLPEIDTFAHVPYGYSVSISLSKSPGVSSPEETASSSSGSRAWILSMKER